MKYSFLVVKVLPVVILFLLFVLEVHLQYYLQISAFFFYGCDFLINRGCDNHIIITCIILVNYLTIKKPTLVFAFLCQIHVHVLIVYMYVA